MQSACAAQLENAVEHAFTGWATVTATATRFRDADAKLTSSLRTRADAYAGPATSNATDGVG